MTEKIGNKYVIGYFFVFTILSTIAFLVIVDLRLAYHVQQPLFLLDFQSFKLSFSIPGGVTEYLSLFFTELYSLPIVGSIASSLVVAILPFTIFKNINAKTNQIFALTLSCSIYFLSFLLISIYHFKLSTLVVAIGSYYFSQFAQLVLKLKNISLKTILFLLTLLLSFIILGGFGLLITVILIFIEVLLIRDKTKYAFAFLAILFYALVPLTLVHLTFQLMPLKDAYWGSFIYDDHYTTPVIYYVLLSILPLAIIFSNIKQSTTLNKWIVLTSIVIGAAIMFGIPNLSKQKQAFKLIKIDYLAYHKQWNKLLEFTTNDITKNQFATFHANRAIFFTNGLANKAFSIEQNFRLGGLLLDQNINRKMLINTSDIYYDLGLINESRHWIHEAFTSLGYQPRILKRLVLVNIINNKLNTAKKYIGLLKKSPVNKKWALEHEQLLVKPDKIKDYPDLYNKRKNLPPNDFFINRHMPIQNLFNLTNQKGEYKMALEYIVAYYLFEHNVIKVIKQIPFFRKYAYTELPQLVQEAAILYMVKAQTNKMDLYGYKLENENFTRFNEYTKLYAQYVNHDKSAKQKLDAKFSDSYWYYIHFTSPITKAKK